MYFNYSKAVDTMFFTRDSLIVFRIQMCSMSQKRLPFEVKR